MWLAEQRQKHKANVNHSNHRDFIADFLFELNALFRKASDIVCKEEKDITAIKN